MRRLIGIIAALAWLLVPPSLAQAQDIVSAQTVSVCGTPNNTPVVGNSYPITQDTQGRLCTPPGGTSTSPSITQPVGATSTDASGTVTAGGTYQTIQAATATRKGCTVQNPLTATETLNVRVGTTTAFFLAPGSTFNCEVGGIVVTDAIAVTAATTAHAFAANFQ